jgi:hypothetical protein
LSDVLIRVDRVLGDQITCSLHAGLGKAPGDKLGTPLSDQTRQDLAEGRLNSLRGPLTDREGLKHTLERPGRLEDARRSWINLLTRCPALGNFLFALVCGPCCEDRKGSQSRCNRSTQHARGTPKFPTDRVSGLKRRRSLDRSRKN